MGTGSFPWVKSGRGVTLTPHPLLVPWSRKGRAIPLPPSGPHGLYRAPVPVQGCNLPRNVKECSLVTICRAAKTVIYVVVAVVTISKVLVMSYAPSRGAPSL